jgi:hypothetical protein
MNTGALLHESLPDPRLQRGPRLLHGRRRQGAPLERIHRRHGRHRRRDERRGRRSKRRTGHQRKSERRRRFDRFDGWHGELRRYRCGRRRDSAAAGDRGLHPLGAGKLVGTGSDTARDVGGGPGLSFTVDSTTYSKYSIQSVTVARE